MESIFSLFYFPNLAFALFFPFFQILVYSKAIRLKFNFSNPLLISCLFSFPFLLFTVVLGPYEILTEFYSNSIFHFALGMDNLYAFCRFTSVLFLFALLQKLKKRVGELPISKVKKISKTRLRKIGFLFLTTSLILIIFIARLANKDFFDLIRDPRDVYQNHRFGVGYLYALSTSYFLPFGMAFFLCTKPKKLLLMSVFSLALFIAHCSGSKGTILQVATSFIIFAFFYRDVKLKLLAVTVAIIAASGMLFNYSISAGKLNLETVFRYFDYFPNAIRFYREVFEGKLPHFFGDVFITDFWAYIPRSLVPEKPSVYGVILVLEHFWPGMAALGHTPGLTAAVPSYADFGTLGVIVFGLIDLRNLGLALALTFLKRIDHKSQVFSAPEIVVLTWVFFPTFLGYFPPGASAIIILLTIVLIPFLNALVGIRVIKNERKKGPTFVEQF